MREGLGRAALYHGGRGSFAGACVACARVLESIEPTVAGRSMQEMLLFERSIPNTAGIGWVGSDLYMVALVAAVPGASALHDRSSMLAGREIWVCRVWGRIVPTR